MKRQQNPGFFTRWPHKVPPKDQGWWAAEETTGLVRGTIYFGARDRMHARDKIQRLIKQRYDKTGKQSEYSLRQIAGPGEIPNPARRKNLFGFGHSKLPSTVPARGGIAAHMPKTRAVTYKKTPRASEDTDLLDAITKSQTKKKTFKSLSAEEKAAVRQLASRMNPALREQAERAQEERRRLYAQLKGRDTLSESAKPIVKRILALDRKIQKLSFQIAQGNPGKGSFARCVSAVSKRGGASDPNAVCAASKQRTAKGARELQRVAKAGKRKANKKRGNPAQAATEAYEEFHGRQPDETIEVRKSVHFHRHLAGAGKLLKLEIAPERGGDHMTLQGFKGAVLAFNEAKNQLFIEGGDQAVDLKAFGIRQPHETETLGKAVAVEYHTTKDHLGSEGGTAIYVHKFEKPQPHVIYSVRDEQLTFSGGGYDIKAEGIDK